MKGMVISMKVKDFEKLQIGDLCIIKRGHDNNKKCEVLWKEDSYVLLKSLDGVFKTVNNDNSRFRLTTLTQIDMI